MGHCDVSFAPELIGMPDSSLLNGSQKHQLKPQCKRRWLSSSLECSSGTKGCEQQEEKKDFQLLGKGEKELSPVCCAGLITAVKKKKSTSLKPDQMEGVLKRRTCSSRTIYLYRSVEDNITNFCNRGFMSMTLFRINHIIDLIALI